MIEGLKPYPRMKDSGVPWLGEVPEHWEVRKLRQILRQVTERNRVDLPLLSIVREKGVILRDTTNKETNHNFITMYVDKVLSSIKAVQTLSRLNRAHPQKHDVFVLDFMSDTDTIQEAFADYHRTTTLNSSSSSWTTNRFDGGSRTQFSD